MNNRPPPVMLSDEEPMARGRSAEPGAEDLPPPVTLSDEEPTAAGGR